MLKALFERHNEKLLSRRKFLIRLLKFGLISVVLILVSLVIGMAGYHIFEGLSWVDAFLNAAMLMGGMGPVNALSMRPSPGEMSAHGRARLLSW